ncbi:MAG: FemAB family XrtA/PEP-CTERM system-associated protein [Pseudomonadota bacterium]|nr:FemAB family XrtA/PEP-CTERM system-associated protein [Pseudomonadota bacterium]
MQPQQKKKKILADPVSLFCHHHPEASDQQTATLHTLAQQYNQLDKQHRDVQKQTQQLSRLIGNARKNGESVDELMTSMRTHSKHLKTLSAELTDTGNRILDYFEGANDPDGTGDKQAAIQGRVYPLKEKGCPEASISLIDDIQDDWNHYVESNPAASIYHRAEWKELIKKTFGHAGYYFAARNSDGKIIGTLPLTRLTSRLFGDFMVSMPYFNYGGAIADHPEIEQQLMQTAADHVADLGVSHIEYRDDTPREGFPARTEKVNMILPLPGSHDTLWKAFTPKLRAQIRRAQREKLQVLQGGEEYLKDFYTVFARNMRDLGTPVYSKLFFRNILNSFPGACRIMVVRLDNRPVAAGFLIGHRDTLEIPWASTIRDVNHLSINMLLYWEVLKYAIDKRYTQFDFGRSSKDSGTYRFKQQWGAQPRQLYWHYWLRSGDTLPSIKPDNPKYTLMINLWKRLPIMLSTLLGPKIVKNIP